MRNKFIEMHGRASICVKIKLTLLMLNKLKTEFQNTKNRTYITVTDVDHRQSMNEYSIVCQIMDRSKTRQKL